VVINKTAHLSRFAFRRSRQTFDGVDSSQPCVRSRSCPGLPIPPPDLRIVQNFTNCRHLAKWLGVIPNCFQYLRLE
jgi:hypothetical protein